MYAQYTRVFGTCKEPQKSIKFSPFYRGRGPQKILLYFWGEGANEQKTNKRKKRVCLVKIKSCDAYAPSHEPVKNPVRGPHKILCTCGAKWHQNSAVLGELYLSTQKGAFLLVFYSVQRTLCHSEELHCNDVRIPRKGTILQNPRKILLYLRATKNAPWKRCVFDWFNN